jgi:EAL domain-containing protein (putative c-di-GMP-specific phosphodiesterase class I)
MTPEPSDPPGDRRSDVVAVVDDEALVLSSLRRSLASSFEVVTYQAAEDALEGVRNGSVSVVLSDVAMPGMNGLDLLAAVRAHDPDLPVLLMTAAPTLEGATKAIELGVYRYLHKPIKAEEVSALLAQASALHRLAKLKREALELRESLLPEPSPPSASFQQVLESVWVAFQPIVLLSGRHIFGYEALLRSEHPDFRSPSHLLDAAERAQALTEVGRRVRRLAAEGLRAAPHDALLFVNLHPRDLLDRELSDPRSPLSAVASRVVLEVTERAPLEGIPGLAGKVESLRRLGFRIAIDDLGAGYAGLSSFAALEPEVVKVDMSLTRRVDGSPVKQKLVASLVGLCREMGITLVVEGVETPDERDTLFRLGCDLMQGHLFARPGPALPEPQW